MQVSIPVGEPGDILTVAVFNEPKGRIRESGATLVGILRFRISHLPPDSHERFKLPLVERGKNSARENGNIIMHISTEFPDRVAVYRRYTRPWRPMKSLMLQRYLPPMLRLVQFDLIARDLVQGWINTCSPSIDPNVVAIVSNVGRSDLQMPRLYANFNRIRYCIMLIREINQVRDHIKSWDNPYLSFSVLMVAVFFLVSKQASTDLLIVLIFCIMLALGFRNNANIKRYQPPRMRVKPLVFPNPHLDQSERNNPRAKLRKLRQEGLRIQVILDDVANFLERFLNMLTWHDPQATMSFVLLLSTGVVGVLTVGLHRLVAFGVIMMLRPPFMKRTSVPP